jgi:hypothetical protein
LPHVTSLSYLKHRLLEHQFTESTGLNHRVSRMLKCFHLLWDSETSALVSVEGLIFVHQIQSSNLSKSHKVVTLVSWLFDYMLRVELEQGWEVLSFTL